MDSLRRQSHSTKARVCLLALALLTAIILLSSSYSNGQHHDVQARLQARAPSRTRSVVTVTTTTTVVSIYTPPAPDPVTVTEYTSNAGTKTTTLFETFTQIVRYGRIPVLTYFLCSIG